MAEYTYLLCLARVVINVKVIMNQGIASLIMKLFLGKSPDYDRPDVTPFTHKPMNMKIAQDYPTHNLGYSEYTAIHYN